MAITTIGVDNVQTVKRWASQVVRELNSANTWRSFIGGTNNMIAEKEDLRKGSGDTITVPFIWKNVGPAVVGDVSIIDKLQNIKPTADKLVVNQAQVGYIAPNRESISQQRVTFDFLQQSRLNLLQQVKDNFEIGLLAQLAGYNCNTFLVDGRAPMYVPDGADYFGLNVILPPGQGRWFAVNQTAEAKLTAKDTMSSKILNGLVAKAETANPVFGRISGLEQGVGYVLIMHPTQEQQFRDEVGENTWSEVTKFAYMGKGSSSDNPLYGKIIGIWRDTLLLRSRYVPYGVNEDGTPNYNVRRAVFCGANAALYARAAYDKDSGDTVDIYLDATMDGGNKTAVIGKRIYGIKKARYDREGRATSLPDPRYPDNAVFVISTWAPDDYNSPSGGLTPIDVSAEKQLLRMAGEMLSPGQIADIEGEKQEQAAAHFKAKNAPNATKPAPMDNGK